MPNGFFLGGLAEGVQRERENQFRQKQIDIQNRQIQLGEDRLAHDEHKFDHELDLKTKKGRIEALKGLQGDIKAMTDSLIADIEKPGSMVNEAQLQKRMKAIQSVSATAQRLGASAGVAVPDLAQMSANRISGAVKFRDKSAAEAAAKAGETQANLDVVNKPENVKAAAEAAGIKDLAERKARVDAFEAQFGGGSFAKLPQADQMRVLGFGGGTVINNNVGAVSGPGKMAEDLNRLKTTDPDNPAIPALERALDKTGADKPEKPPNMNEAGRIAMVESAGAALDTVNGLLFPDGMDADVDRGNLTAFALRAGDSGRLLHSNLIDAVSVMLRLETGAQANPEEVENMMDRFAPSLFDGSAVIRDKMRRLKTRFDRAISLVQKDQAAPMSEPASNELPAGASLVGHKNGNPVYRLPDGSLVVQE